MPWRSREGFALTLSSEAAQHLEIFRVQIGRDAISQQFSKSLVVVEHGEQVEALRPGVFEIVGCIRRHCNEVTGSGCDRSPLDVEEHSATQHEIELG